MVIKISGGPLPGESRNTITVAAGIPSEGSVCKFVIAAQSGGNKLECQAMKKFRYCRNSLHAGELLRSR
tara:strand:+ start:2946 stop:3152 length:207 start_codon:yes stop_codon:yes gene_type:complete